MHIRTLGESDLDALLTLYAHIFSADNPMPSREQSAAIWRELLAGERYRYFGGFVSETLVCACALTMVPNLTSAGAPFGLIEHVVTDVDQRKKGYGRAVLQAALDHAWAEGCSKVVLLSGRKDEASLRFFEAVGLGADARQGFIARP